MATVYVAWVDSNRVYFNKSTDDGDTWGTPQTIDSGVTANITRHSPKMQLDADGDVYVVWVEKNTDALLNQIKINHTANGGTTWSGVVTVSDLTGLQVTEYIGFIIDSTGYLWIFFGRTVWSPGVWYYRSNNVKDHTVWNDEVYIGMSLEPASQIEVCEDENNWLWMVYISGGDILCHRYADVLWFREADVETAGVLEDPSVYSETDFVFVAYYESGAGKCYVRPRHNGGWGAAVEFATGQWPSIGGCLLWATYVGTTASMEVNQKNSDDAGATWGAAAEISHGEGDGEAITGAKAVNYAHTPYVLFVTASHKIYCCKGSATE